ncbi:hypothetical protein Tco_1307453 [Tanacetum coccineum]
MANENVLAAAPTRTDEQILSFAAWVPIGKINFVLDLQKKQKNPIFQISITPIDQAHQFVSPPLGDAIMDFVNELGYTEVIHFVSRMVVNNLYQPWRAILSMINQCLTGKTSGYDSPRFPVLQMLWGIITSTNVDYDELMWEKFVQAIQTFLTDKANLGSPTKKGKKDKPHIIPYCRFTKLIIYHLGRTHNIHQISASSFHLAKEDLRLGNLKFVPKGEKDEVFGMPVPNELISNNIRNTPYYNAYMEMVAKHDQKITAEKGEKKKPATAKQPKPKPAKEKSSKPAPAPKPKVTKEKPSKPSLAKHPKRGKVQKLRKGKPSLQLIDEDEPTQPKLEPETEHQGEAEATRPLPIVEGKGKAIATEEQAAQSLLALHTPKRRSTTDQFIFQRWTPATEEASTRPSAQPHDDTFANIVRDSSSPTDAKIGAHINKTNNGGDNKILKIGEEQGDDVANVVNLEEKTAKIDEGQAGSDPGKSPESRPPPERVFIDEDQVGPDPGESRVALAGPDPEPTHNEFMANVYPNVHETLKFPADEHVILEEPLSSSGTLSSMKNLDDAYTIGDQFINDKSTKDEPGKLNVDSEVVSMVIVPIHQASSLTTDTREAPSSSSKQQYGPHSKQLVEDVPMPDTANISDSEDTDSSHLPKIKPRPKWLKPIPEEDIPATPKPDWSIPMNDLFEPENNWANALAKSYKDPEENKPSIQVDLVNPEGHWLVPDVSKPLPLGGPPLKVTIQSQFFFNKDLEYLVSGDKGRRSALSISKLKAAQYLDFGLEELVMSWNG